MAAWQTNLSIYSAHSWSFVMSSTHIHMDLAWLVCGVCAAIDRLWCSFHAHSSVWIQVCIYEKRKAKLSLLLAAWRILRRRLSNPYSGCVFCECGIPKEVKSSWNDNNSTTHSTCIRLRHLAAQHHHHQFVSLWHFIWPNIDPIRFFAGLSQFAKSFLSSFSVIIVQR